MKKLELSEEKALELYKNADPVFKSLLEENWSKEFFNQEITDRVRTVQDAFKIANIDFKSFVSNLKNANLNKDLISTAILQVVAKVLNEGWKPNWNDPNEGKPYSYFVYDKEVGSFVFSHTLCDYASTGTHLGSRLYFRTRKLAEHAGRTFIEEYNQMLDPHFNN